MNNGEKIFKLTQLTDILKNYMEEDNFLKGKDEYINKIINVKEKLENRKFTVSIIAAMKAGKSTAFNALIGRDLLPNERAACTASITEIKHAKKRSDYVLKKYTDGSYEKILAKEGKTLEECFHEDVRNSRKKDSVKSIEKYYVETPIKALEGTDYENLIQNFVLVDTPGPNEADIGEFDVTILQHLALEQLRNSDALIMLLDYENYKSETNAKILKDIFENRDDLEKEQSKVYFLLNKIDSMGSKDGTIEEVLNSVKKLIKEYAPVIKDPKVYGFSGKQAMFSRAVLNKTANEEMKRQMELDYGSRFSTIIQIGDKEVKTIPQADNFAEELLKMSRVEVIERDIITEVFNNASGDMIENATRKIWGVSNHILEMAQSKILALDKTDEELKKIVDESKEKILGLRQRGEIILGDARGKIEEIENSINDRLDELEDKTSEILELQIPEEESIESASKEALIIQRDGIQKNCLNAIKTCLIGEIDKIQRECLSAQTELNNKINIEFNELIREMTKEANEKINFTPKAFDINEALEIHANVKFEEEEQSDGTYEKIEFSTGGAVLGVGGGIAMGAAIGSIVPILGTAIGSVVGGIVGGLAGAGKNTIKEKTKTVYKFSVTELRVGLEKSTRQQIERIKEELRNNIEVFSKGYKLLIESEFNNFAKELDEDLDKIMIDYDTQKGNRDKEIDHMKEIEKDMEEVLEVVKQFK